MGAPPPTRLAEVGPGLVDAIRAGLSNGDWLYRYRAADDFGTPEVAFVICSFWLVEALGRTGKPE